MVLNACGLGVSEYGLIRAERIRSGKVTLLSFPHRKQRAHLRGAENKGAPQGRWMAAVCLLKAEPQQKPAPQKRPVAPPEGLHVHICILHPSNTCIGHMSCSLKSDEGEADTIYKNVTCSCFGVIICTDKLFGFMNNQFLWAERCTKEQAG